jgi:hypothetical protein
MVLIPAWSIVFLPILVGCATTTTSAVGQVREVAPGTYKIGVAGGAGSVVFGSHQAADAAVSQAGQYCHAKGQKLVVLPTRDRNSCTVGSNPIPLRIILIYNDFLVVLISSLQNQPTVTLAVLSI